MDDAEGFWLTITGLAKLRSVDKGGLSRRVARLEALGLVKTRAGKNSTKLVNVAEFDRATEQATDGIRALNGAAAASAPPAAPAATSDPTLQREQARRAGYAADLAKLELDERLKRLVPVEDVYRALDKMADEIVLIIDQMPTKAEDMSAAVAKSGEVGGRNFLRELAREQRQALARALAELASVIERPAGEVANVI